MCESNAYLVRNGEEELLMESVDYLRLEKEGVILRSIFGEETRVDAIFREMNLTKRRIVLESSK